MDEDPTQITLRLTGERARDGIEFAAFEAFTEQFLAALRYFHRHRAGRDPKSLGAPRATDSAATAFRLVRLEPGSALVTVRPEHVTEAGPLELRESPLSETVLTGLLDAVDTEAPLPADVTGALENARRACGAGDGAFAVTTQGNGKPGRTVRFNTALIERLAGPPTPDAPPVVDRVTGRLVKLEEQPERVVIRTAEGIEWTCEYDAEIADKLGALWRRTVWASGQGTLSSALKGRMRVHEILPVPTEDAQTSLFTPEPVPLPEILAKHGVRGPQGLDALAADDVDEEAEARFLAAILGS